MYVVWELTFQMFALTEDNLLKTILQCIVVRGYFLTDKEPNMFGCFDGPSEKWQHKKVYSATSPQQASLSQNGCCRGIINICNATSILLSFRHLLEIRVRLYTAVNLQTFSMI